LTSTAKFYCTYCCWISKHACTHAHCQRFNNVGLWAYSIWRPDRTKGDYLLYSHMRRCYVT